MCSFASTLSVEAFNKDLVLDVRCTYTSSYGKKRTVSTHCGLLLSGRIQKSWCYYGFMNVSERFVTVWSRQKTAKSTKPLQLTAQKETLEGSIWGKLYKQKTRSR